MKNPKIKHVPCYSVYPAGTEMPSREDFFAAIDSLEFSPRILVLKVFDSNNELRFTFHAALFAAVDDKLSVYLRPIDFEFAPNFIDACPRIAHVDDLYYALDCASDVIFGDDDDYLVAKFQHVNFPAPIREYLAKCKARRENNQMTRK